MPQGDPITERIYVLVTLQKIKRELNGMLR